jgi:FixJ family two-component response regulator
MKFRNASALRAGLYSFLVRAVFLARQLRKTGPLVSKQDVISIVDDNASIRGAIKRLIESADLIVEEFASAEEFLLSGRSQNSACLILDLRLSGMSGLDLQSQLQLSNPRLPIIFMSASADEISTARARQLAAVEFLEKPIDEQALFAAIDSSLILSRSRGIRPEGFQGAVD